MNVSLTLVPQLIELMREQGLPVGAHLAAQKLADKLQVSRSPVNEALRSLEASGLVKRSANRGYFLAQDLANLANVADWVGDTGEQQDVVTQAYFAIADDLLKGDLPMTCTEVQFKTQYGLTQAQTQALLNRISNEGWIARKPGYGWAFSPMLTTADSLLQSYRLRLALEPAALLEPGFRISPEVIARCRAAEQHLLQGGIDLDSADQLHDRGVRFHESLVEASGNPFFIDTIKRVNKVRRLLSYRSMQNRARYPQHCEQHLEILSLLEQKLTEQAANALRQHLASTLENLTRIGAVFTTDARLGDRS